jgi:hypothetical protein
MKSSLSKSKEVVYTVKWGLNVYNNIIKFAQYTKSLKLVTFRV